jgi:hypothetical protein
MLPDWITPELVELIDLDDPDIRYVTAAVQALRSAGLDVTVPANLALAVKLGHENAARATDDAVFATHDERRLATLARRTVRRPTQSVVYYMRLGNRCKIGWSADVNTRMQTIAAEELLATEPGGPKLEQQRHDEFRRLRTSGEWFRYESPLTEHVEQLRAA